MPDREKVIKGLETIKQFFGYGLPSTAEMFDSYYGILNDAIALLKEQESVEPDPTEQIVFGTNRKCSNCGKYLFPACKFCPHCGRTVKWNDT